MTGFSGGSVYVLHVDDDPATAARTAERIERRDERFDVETATGAGDGLDLLGENGYDCIVSAYAMAGQDGIEFLRTVREDYPDLPFVLYTAEGSEAVASEAISAGVTDYLRRESGTEQYEVLADLIRTAVDRYHTRREFDRNRDLFEHTEQLADVGGWEVDVETGEQRWTDGTYAVHDIAPDSGFDPTADAGVELFHPDDRDEIQQRVERCMEDGEPFDVELRLATGDDRVRWVRATGEPVRRGGEVASVRGAVQDVTERKERAQELERTRQKFQRVFEHSNDAIFISDIENDRIVDCNQAAANLVGVTREELCSVAPSELHPHNFDAVKGWVETVLEEGSGRTDGITCRRLDGEIIPVEMSAGVAEFDGARCLVNNVVDISDRKAREAELEQEKRRFETVFENSNDAIFVLDPKNDAIRNANPQAADLLGYSREELVSSVAISDVHGDHLGEFQAFIDTVREDGHGWTNQFPCKTSDGDTVEAAISMAPIELDGTTYLLANVRDITERKERERELRERKRQLQAVLDSVEASIWIRDLEHRFELVNQDWRGLFGYGDEADIAGKRPAELLSEELATQFRANDRAVIETGEPVELEEEVPTERGTRTFLTRINPLFDDDGEVFSTCGVASDITAQKERERMLERHNERLDQFASTLRHELRNPLNILDGYLDVARETGSAEAFESCQTAVDQMQRLLEQTLVVLKRGDASIDLAAVELDVECEACWGALPETDAQLEIATERALVADPDRLKQLLGNLFRNAAEHGGDDVSVRVGDVDGGFHVEDDGPGIPESARNAVFDEGYSTNEAGTGLGLAVVEAVAIAHGWDVRITDSTMGGARFEITGVDRP